MLDWINFDLEEWQNITKDGPNSEVNRVYMKEGVFLSKAIKHLPSDFPLGIENIREVMHRQTSQTGGVIISCNIHEFGKTDGVISILKMKTDKPTGFRFLASIIICYRDFFYAINLQAEEQGITGMRESVMMIALKIPADFTDWFVHPYGNKFNENTQVKYNLSDAAEYDEKFPNHPLTRVRNTISSIVRSISFSEDLKYCESYPLE